MRKDTPFDTGLGRPWADRVSVSVVPPTGGVSG